jgi:hypothetical protein
MWANFWSLPNSMSTVHSDSSHNIFYAHSSTIQIIFLHQHTTSWTASICAEFSTCHRSSSATSSNTCWQTTNSTVTSHFLRCNFAHQFKLIQQRRPLAIQLQQILLTTSQLSAAPPRSSRRLTLLLNADLLDKIHTQRFENATQAVSIIRTYRTSLTDASTILTQFAKMTRVNTVLWKQWSKELPGCDHEMLSDVERHRILRAILRMQLYS